MPQTSTQDPKEKSELETINEPSSQTMTVVKRSGVIVPFHFERIANAIEGAVRDAENIDKGISLSPEYKEMIIKVTQSVSDSLKQQAKKGLSLTVEGIQDIVEEKLMDLGFHHIAKSYIIYRNKHSQLRESKENFPQVLRADQKTIVRFNPIKIGSKLEHAFRHTFNIEGPTPADIFETVNELTQTILRNLVDQNTGEPISTDDIEEEVENELMAHGYFKVAKFLILKHQGSQKPTPSLSSLEPVKGEALKKPFSVDSFLKEIFNFATKDF